MNYDQKTVSQILTRGQCHQLCPEDCIASYDQRTVSPITTRGQCHQLRPEDCVTNYDQRPVSPITTRGQCHQLRRQDSVTNYDQRTVCLVISEWYTVEYNCHISYRNHTEAGFLVTCTTFNKHRNVLSLFYLYTACGG